MKSSLLIKNGTVVTLGERNRVLPAHDLWIEGSRIRAITPTGTSKSSADRVIDATGKVVLPGFINTHMHFYSSFARGLSKAKPSADFQEVLKNLWWRLDRKLTLEDCYMSALVALIDSIKKGTTTIIDHHASPGAVRGSLDQIARAVKETGLRASLCYEVSDRDGPKVAADGLTENLEFIQRCKKNGDDQVHALFGLHASFTISDKTLALAVKLGRDNSVGFHVHTAEAESDQADALQKYKMRVVERFERAGVLGPDTICAHCVHVNEREMDLLRESGTQVVHNPQSNMNNAVGIADVVGMSKKSITVGLGTDAMTVNMLEELRSAVWAQKLRSGNPSAGFMESLGTLVNGNAKIANRYFNLGLGELREGAAADIVIMDYRSPTPLNDESILGHLCFGLAESTVDTTIASGKVLMEQKRLQIDLDEERIYARSQELARDLWKRF